MSTSLISDEISLCSILGSTMSTSLISGLSVVLNVCQVSSRVEFLSEMHKRVGSIASYKLFRLDIMRLSTFFVSLGSQYWSLSPFSKYSCMQAVGSASACKLHFSFCDSRHLSVFFSREDNGTGVEEGGSFDSIICLIIVGGTSRSVTTSVFSNWSCSSVGSEVAGETWCPEFDDAAIAFYGSALFNNRTRVAATLQCEPPLRATRLQRPRTRLVAGRRDELLDRHRCDILQTIWLRGVTAVRHGTGGADDPSDDSSRPP